MSDKFTFGSAGLIHELEMGMARAGDWDPALVKLLTSGDHLVYVREYLRGRAKMVAIQSSLNGTPPQYPTITVDYGLTLEQMIAAAHYDWKNSDITTKRFPITGSGTVTLEARLFHFNRLISSEEVVKLILSADQTNPWQAAKIEHELAYGATYPEEQRQFLIVALGSSCRLGGNRYVPCLGRRGAGRNLGLNYWDVDWSAACRFLAVRPLSVRQPAD